MASNVVKKSKEKLHRIDGQKGGVISQSFGIWSLIYLWLRSTTLIQGSFNYAYFQGTGYSHTLLPFLKKIFKNNKEKFKSSLISNIEFFNTGPAMGITAITSLHLFMLQQGSTEEQAKKIKFALMGPLAGINDSLFNFGSQPLIAGIAASLSANGSWSGFWFWLIVYNAFQFTAGIILTIVTYRAGQKFMTDISSIMGSIVKIASMVGVTVVAALSLTYTGIKLNIQTITTIASEGNLTQKITSYQAILNVFAPYLLQILLVGGVYMAMGKYNWSLYKTLFFILILGMTGFVFGIF